MDVQAALLLICICSKAACTEYRAQIHLSIMALLGKGFRQVEPRKQRFRIHQVPVDVASTWKLEGQTVVQASCRVGASSVSKMTPRVFFIECAACRGSWPSTHLSDFPSRSISIKAAMSQNTDRFRLTLAFILEDDRKMGSSTC